MAKTYKNIIILENGENRLPLDWEKKSQNINLLAKN